MFERDEPRSYFVAFRGFWADSPRHSRETRQLESLQEESAPKASLASTGTAPVTASAPTGSNKMGLFLVATSPSLSSGDFHVGNGESVSERMPA
jgi:hypothetical protein